ncbi:MAG TPA: PilZ domain-containing protein [Terracidiphilus sp.]|nr:PilZ domain-containing protein [Terracidiphilus sp.]
MNTAIIGAYNVDSERLLGAEFLAVDAVNEPLRVIKILMEGLETDANGGYWFVDFHGLPVAKAHQPYGLLYLDEGHRVIQALAVSPHSGFEPIRGVPMSALVVSATALVASRTKAGDQLLLSLVKRTTGQPEIVAEPMAPLPGQLRPRVFSVGSERTVLPPGNRAHGIHSGPMLGPTSSMVPPVMASTDELESATQERAAKVLPVDDVQRTQEAAVTGELSLPQEREERDSEEIPAAVDESSEGGTTAADEAAPKADLMLRVEAQPESTPDAVARALQRRDPDAEDHPWSVRLLYGLFPELHPSYRPDFVAPRADYWKEKDKASYEPAAYVRALSLLYPELKLETVVREQREKRRAPRIVNPGLVGHYYNGGAPRAHEIRSLSLSGFFMKTQEKWLPGTIVRVTLQRPNENGDDPDISVTVSCRVVNVSAEGTGFEFVLPGLFE